MIKARAGLVHEHGWLRTAWEPRVGLRVNAAVEPHAFCAVFSPSLAHCHKVRKQQICTEWVRSRGISEDQVAQPPSSRQRLLKQLAQDFVHWDLVLKAMHGALLSAVLTCC